ncbi:hypothetical protein L6250_01620 [Candidatus Parcubacteria bacterium]|nr:hypothetical protein [Patescibacteria group bacterium]MBU4467068.1 hypothetical protein [Patescibacteria group bacterium]MCG2688314.1 hypothetical protein [Candidatus Parcubacteria bacterium]
MKRTTPTSVSDAVFLEQNGKLLLTSAAYEKNPQIGKELLKLVGKKPSKIKIFVVSTAKEKDKDWKWVKLTVSQLGKKKI